MAPRVAIFLPWSRLMFSALLNRFEPGELASVTEDKIIAALIKEEIKDRILNSDSRRYPFNGL